MVSFLLLFFFGFFFVSFFVFLVLLVFVGPFFSGLIKQPQTSHVTPCRIRVLIIKILFFDKILTVDSLQIYETCHRGEYVFLFLVLFRANRNSRDQTTFFDFCKNVFEIFEIILFFSLEQFDRHKTRTIVVKT